MPILQPDARGVAHQRPPSVRVASLRRHPAVDPPAVVQHLHWPLDVKDSAPAGRVPRCHLLSPPAPATETPPGVSEGLRSAAVAKC